MRLRWQFWKAKKSNNDLPKEFDRCPHCGSRERIGEEVIKEIKFRDEVGDNFPETLLMPIPMMDQDKIRWRAEISLAAVTAMTVKVLTFSWDVCAQCGTLYCINAELSTQPLQVRTDPGQQPPPHRNIIRRP